MIILKDEIDIHEIRKSEGLRSALAALRKKGAVMTQLTMRMDEELAQNALGEGQCTRLSSCETV